MSSHRMGDAMAKKKRVSKKKASKKRKTAARKKRPARKKAATRKQPRRKQGAGPKADADRRAVEIAILSGGIMPIIGA